MKKKYYVEIQVNYCGDLWAESEAEAEQLAWTSYYGDNAPLEYDSVEEIRVEEYEHCEECGECLDDGACDCCEDCGKAFDLCKCDSEDDDE